MTLALITVLTISCRSPQPTTSVETPPATVPYAPVTSVQALEIAQQAAMAWDEHNPVLLGMRQLSRRGFEEYLKTQGEVVELEGEDGVWIVEFEGDFGPKRHPELGCTRMHVVVDAETGSVLGAGCQ
jgi:hypothetical protein